MRLINQLAACIPCTLTCTPYWCMTIKCEVVGKKYQQDDSKRFVLFLREEDVLQFF